MLPLIDSRRIAHIHGNATSVSGLALGPNLTGGPVVAFIVWPIRSQSSVNAPGPNMDSIQHFDSQHLVGLFGSFKRKSASEIH